MGKSRRTQTRKTSNGSNVKLKPGSILCDKAKDVWHMGKPIGAGGFGDVYLASKDPSRPVPADTTYVAKVELKSNGPLFVEMNFYLRVGKEDTIRKWKTEHRLKHLGMPRYIASGSHTCGPEEFRFLILERYGSDIGSLFLKNGRCFSLKTVLTLGLQILDILEYIHYHGYIHADIKGSNLVLGLGKKDENKVFLLDFGLACLFIDRYGRHKEFNHDLRRAHDGTLEYTSRDAHVGAHSRRGDLEVLGYNMVQWLCGELPWEKDLPDPDQVAASKNLYMSNTSHLMDKCFPRGGAPVVIHQYLKYVASLGFTAKPDYDRLRSMLRQGMRAASLEDNGLLNLGSLVNKKISRKRGHGSDTENTRNAKRAKCEPKSLRRPCAPVQVFERKTRQKSMIGRTAALRSKEFDWVKILQSHPERDAKPLAKVNKPRRVVQRVLEDVAEDLRRKPENPRLNPTPAMLRILDKQREAPTPAKRIGRSDSHRRSPSPCDAMHLTPAMEEVLQKRSSRTPGAWVPQMTAMAVRALRQRKPTSYVEMPDIDGDEYETAVARSLAKTTRSSTVHLLASPSVEPTVGRSLAKTTRSSTVHLLASPSVEPTVARSLAKTTRSSTAHLQSSQSVEPTIGRSPAKTTRSSTIHLLASPSVEPTVGRSLVKSTRSSTVNLLSPPSVERTFHARTRSNSKTVSPILPYTKAKSTTEYSSGEGLRRITRGLEKKRKSSDIMKMPTLIKRRQTTSKGKSYTEIQTPSDTSDLSVTTAQPTTRSTRSQTFKNVSMPWRPPTPPRKSSNKIVIPSDDLSSSPRRPFSQPLTPSEHSESPKRRVLSRGRESFARKNKREVSPSEVEFMPKLRSGRDPIVEYENACRIRRLHARSASALSLRTK